MGSWAAACSPAVRRPNTCLALAASRSSSATNPIPYHARAWYGIGLVALLDRDAARAKQVFGRLTAGEHAAAQDPMVLAWSHVYLARIYDDEGNPSVAKAEYESALTVQGGPEQAKQAAQRGLAAFGAEKPVARP